MLLVAFASLWAQSTPQNPSPMTDTTRPHTRVSQREIAGRRVELRSLQGARLFVSPKFDAKQRPPLVIHFHSAPWLIETHIADHLPSAALITVQLGAGSRAYATPFAREGLFSEMLDEAAKELGLKNGWSSITLTAWSAGYGAVRAILRQEANFNRVDNVLLLDGMHASYSPEGKPLAEGGVIRSEDLDVFVKFAGEAADGRKTFVITHSEIFPGTFVSTTEAADHLISALKLKKSPKLKQGPMGMQQLSYVNRGRLYIFGYAGNTAPDHVDHIHAMPAWFKYLRIR